MWYDRRTRLERRCRDAQVNDDRRRVYDRRSWDERRSAVERRAGRGIDLMNDRRAYVVIY